MNGGFSRPMESAIPTRILSTLPPKEELKSNESPWFPRLKLSPQAYSRHVSLIHPPKKNLSLYVLVVSPRLGDSKTPRDLVMTHPVVMPIGG